MDLKNWRVDAARATEGVVLMVPGGGGGKVRLAKFENPAHVAALDAAFAPWRRLMRSGDMPREKLTEIMFRAFCEHVWLGFEGFTEDGKPLEDNIETRIRVLRELPEFQGWIVEESKALANFSAEEEAEAEGN